MTKLRRMAVATAALTASISLAAFAADTFKPTRDDQKQYQRVADAAFKAFKDGRYTDAAKQLDDLKALLPEAERRAKEAPGKKDKKKREPEIPSYMVPELGLTLQFWGGGTRPASVVGVAVSERRYTNILLEFGIYRGDVRVGYTNALLSNVIPGEKMQFNGYFSEDGDSIRFLGARGS